MRRARLRRLAKIGRSATSSVRVASLGLRASSQRGQRVILPATAESLERAEVFVLFRRAPRWWWWPPSRVAAEALRARLGPSADAYDLAAVPVERTG